MQSVHALTEVVIIAFCAPVASVIWLCIHRAFRLSAYVITTRRFLAVDERGTCGEVTIGDIQRFRTFRGAMMIERGETRLRLPWLPDGWHLDTILTRCGN